MTINNMHIYIYPLLSEKYDIIEIYNYAAESFIVITACGPCVSARTGNWYRNTNCTPTIGAMVRYKKVKINNITTVLVVINIDFQYGFDIHLSFLE